MTKSTYEERNWQLKGCATSFKWLKRRNWSCCSEAKERYRPCMLIVKFWPSAKLCNSIKKRQFHYRCFPYCALFFKTAFLNPVKSFGNIKHWRLKCVIRDAWLEPTVMYQQLITEGSIWSALQPKYLTFY